MEKKRVEEREEGEEGSTPYVVMYTPGYDYVVVDGASEEEGGIIDLDLTTATPQVTPTLQARPPPVYMTRGPTTASYSTPNTGTETWAKTTHHPQTTPRMDPYRPGTHMVPITTRMYKSLAVSARAASKRFTTVASPHSTSHVTKMSKSAEKPPSQPKGSRSKKQKQKSHARSSSRNQSKLKPREPVAVDAFWVAGNWSEVRVACPVESSA